jgi:hypothetical protein
MKVGSKATMAGSSGAVSLKYGTLTDHTFLQATYFHTLPTPAIFTI